MDTSAIPHDTKQRLAREIRDQLGYEQYDDLVGRLGEEGLLRLVTD